jgi:hypothetical protein
LTRLLHSSRPSGNSFLVVYLGFASDSHRDEPNVVQCDSCNSPVAPQGQAVAHEWLILKAKVFGSFSVSVVE